MSNNQLLGIYGGTFDPIHLGHLAVARYVLQHCQLQSIRFLPCHLPPHRATPGVNSEQRAAMVQRAIAGQPEFVLDKLELQLAQPSYTVHSLRLLKSKFPDATLCFILGMDSLCSFRSWHQWQQILSLCHLIVLQRPGYNSTMGDAPSLLATYAGTVPELQRHSAGKIVLLDNPDFAQSATQIRASLLNPAEPHPMLPKAVWQFICEHRLYGC